MILVIPSQTDTIPSRKRETSTADLAPSKMDLVNSSRRPLTIEKITPEAMKRNQIVFIQG
jgi:hypothetical protein